MDYLLFYSQYSNASQKLLDEFPSLMEKSVSVDSLQMREYLKKIAIVSVPTLILILNEKIVDRIIGYENISDWLNISIYRMNQLNNSVINGEMTQPVETVNDEPMMVQHEDIKDDISFRTNHTNQTNHTNHTNLDDLILEDEIPKNEDIHITRSSQGSDNLLKLAEEMKRERENTTKDMKKRI